MTEEKKQLLEKTYSDWLSIQLDSTTPIALLESLVIKDIMGYGTTLEEKLFGIDDLKQLITNARAQEKHFEEFRFLKPKTVYRQIFPDHNFAIFIDEIDLYFKLGGIQNHIPLRVSSILVYIDSAWKVSHWHASVAVETKEGDTFHADELQLKNQKLEKLIEQRTAELKQSIADLKATQAQLIHTEKMASLGELTAGIAHEIQNPLNFVNNFSELNKELVEEANEELDKGDIKETKIILKHLGENSEKINHHGKRADAIVKGMLQHSRSGGDKKVPTDINALADEYLRLAYHGLRAKDKSFNAELVTDFDESIEAIEIVPQDIGRVILNLVTNAFYAVKQKEQMVSAGYKPTVRIITKQKKNITEIKVIDNGNGIPENVKKKIFQPFFTTKPTGQGTGLGLSMSYDIMTKGHGGDLSFKTKEGEGTTFIIEIPQFN